MVNIFFENNRTFIISMITFCVTLTEGQVNGEHFLENNRTFIISMIKFCVTLTEGQVIVVNT